MSTLPEPVSRRGITEPQWRTMANNLYPGADVNSVLMVWDYCAARKLDPMKKPCHIVPMQVKDAKTGRYSYRDVVLPGIYELRTTAMRTGEYMGHSAPVYGPPAECVGVTAPEWCEMTIYRWNDLAKARCEFPVRVHFAEVVATAKDGGANQRWQKAPVQMLTKCTEAAGLREGFPDELGGVMSEEEMSGQKVIDITPSASIPATYGAWDACDEETQSRLLDLSVLVVDHLNQNEDVEAYLAIAKADLGADDEVALWTRFDSKQRRRLKDAKATYLLDIEAVSAESES